MRDFWDIYLTAFDESGEERSMGEIETEEICGQLLVSSKEEKNFFEQYMDAIIDMTWTDRLVVQSKWWWGEVEDGCSACDRDYYDVWVQAIMKDGSVDNTRIQGSILLYEEGTKTELAQNIRKYCLGHLEHRMNDLLYIHFTKNEKASKEEILEGRRRRGFSAVETFFPELTKKATG